MSRRANPINSYFSDLILRQALPVGRRKKIIRIEGSFLFTDLSGFTAMSDRLSSLGRLGAEELASIINFLFDPLLDLTRSYGGDVVKLGGDAFLTLFTGRKNAAMAAACGLDLIEHVGRSPQVKTSAGEFPIAVHAGLSCGSGLSVIVGDEKTRLDHLFCGPDVSKAYASAEAAGSGALYMSQGRPASMKIDGDLIGPDRSFVRIKEKPEVKLRVIQDRSVPAIDETRLRSFLPAGLHDKLSASSAGRVEGEHRPITAMFIGIDGWHKNLAAADENLDPVNRHIKSLLAITGQYGGNVVRIDPSTGGERVLVLFGAPVMRENAPRDALEAALELMDMTVEFSRSLPEGLRMRIGINSGLAYVGDIGGSHRREYTAMGREINLAARLMSAADWGEIIPGPATLDACPATVSLIDKGHVVLKGFDAPVAIKVISGRIESSRRYGRQVNLVGREMEIRKIDDFVALAADGQGPRMQIRGEAGSGKTTLMDRADRRLRRMHVPVLRSACFEHTANIPLHPFGEILRRILGLSEDDGMETRKEKLRAALAGMGADDWEGLLSRLAGYTIKDSPEISNLSETARRDRTFQLLFSLLAESNNDKPACIIIDDLHWGDATTIAFLSQHAGRFAARRMAVILVSRPSSQIPRHEPGLNIDLGMLDEESSGRLFMAVVGRTVPDDLAADIVRTSGGNPFYLEEMARAVRDAGVEAWSKSKSIPDTVERVITARLDRLDEMVKTTIRTASVIGRVFNVGDLESIFPMEKEKPRIGEFLGESAALDITPLEQSEPVAEYGFRHILTREVAYSGLSYGTRRNLHSALAQKYRAIRRERGIGFELIGHHYERSDFPERAVPYYLAAGLAAGKSFSNSEAIFFLERVLEILRPDDHVNMICRAELALGRVFKLIGDYRRAEVSLRKVSGLCPDGRFWRSRALKELSELYRVETDFGKAETALLELLETDRRNPAFNAIYKNGLGEIARRRGELDVALGHFREAAGYEEKIELDLVAQIHNNMGICLWMLGRLDEALACYRKAGEIYQHRRDLQGTAKILNNSGIVFEQKGDLLSAARRYGRAAGVFEKIGDLRSVGFCHGNLATNYITRGLPEKSREHIDKAMDLFERIGDLDSRALTMGNLTDYHRLTGNDGAAADVCLLALKLAGETGNEELLCEMEIRKANLLAGSGADRAFRLVKSAYEKSREKKWRDLELKAELHLLEIEASNPRAGSGDRVFSRLAKFLTNDLPPQLASGGNKIKGLLLYERGELRSARAAFMTAYSIARKSDLVLDSWEIVNLYGRLWPDKLKAVSKRSAGLESRILEGLSEELAGLMRSGMSRRIELCLSKSGRSRKRKPGVPELSPRSS